MFTVYKMVRWSVTETDPAQCEQEDVLCCVAGIITFRNGAEIVIELFGK